MRGGSANGRVVRRRSSFSPCGRRWREAPDEGFSPQIRSPRAETDPSSVSPPLRGDSRCKASASYFSTAANGRLCHLLPQGEKGRGALISLAVIASEAKQSIYPRVEPWIASLRSQ